MTPGFAQAQNVSGTSTDNFSATGTYLENKTKDFSVSSGDGFIEIEHSFDQELKVEVFSITGKPVKELILQKDSRRISTSGMTPGLYLVSVDDGKGYKAVKKAFVR